MPLSLRHEMLKRRRPSEPLLDPVHEGLPLDNRASSNGSPSKRRTPKRLLAYPSLVLSSTLFYVAVSLVAIWAAISLLAGQQEEQQHWVPPSWMLEDELFPTIVFANHNPKQQRRLHSSLSSRLPRLDVSSMDPRPDVGGLYMLRLGTAPSRVIFPDEYWQYEHYRHELLEAMDIPSSKTDENYWHEEEFAGQAQCLPTNTLQQLHPPKPLCNSVHELRTDLGYDPNMHSSQHYQDYSVKYIGSGYFLDVWLYENALWNSSMALKRFKLRFEQDMEHVLPAQREASVLEALTASERILDIYGLCGGTTLIEPAVMDATSVIMPHNKGDITQAELDVLQQQQNNNTDVVPLNSLTLMEKLDLAIVMAEGLAEVHGLDGLVAHGDVYTDQWLLTLDGKWKLNDFNTAELFRWDVWNHEYCRLPRYDGCHKNWNRPPETLSCGGVTEAMDVWEFGNNLYALMTGLWVFYGDYKTDEKAVMSGVKKGQRAYIDPRYRNRSMVESKLVELMEACWEFDDEQRLSIFDVLRRLRQVKAQHELELQAMSSSTS